MTKPTCGDGLAALGEGRRVLVVDDHPANRIVLTHMLSALGFRAREAADGISALEAVEQVDTPLAAILMDCFMPGLDGFDTTGFIRERERDLRLPRTPILAVTASTEPSDHHRARASGMDEVLTKPLEISRLRAVLAHHLAPQSERPGYRTPDLVGGRADRAREIVEIGGEALLQEIYAAFFEDARKRVQAIGTAVALADTQSLGSLAHGLKGSSLNVGAHAVAESARRLERLGKEGRLDGAADLVRSIHRALTEFESELHVA